MDFRLGDKKALLDGIGLQLGDGRHLTNTIERSVLGSDAGCRYRFCGIIATFTFVYCFHFVILLSSLV